MSETESISISYSINLCIILCLTLRYIFTNKVHIPIPYAAFTILIGLLWGTLVEFIPSMANYTMFLTNVENFLYFYIPAIIFKVGFCLNVHHFRIAFWQVLVITGPVFLTTSCFIGIAMRQIMVPSWTIGQALLFGALCTPVYPMEVVRHLKGLGTYTTPITILLEGEAMFSLCTGIIMSTLIEVYTLNIIAHWYQFVALMLRFVISELLLGCSTGYIFCYLLRNFCHDNISLLIFAVTTPFIIFNVVRMYCGATGTITIIVFAFMMANERNNLEAESNKFLTIAWEMIVIVCTTLLSLSGGFMTAKFIVKQFEWLDLVYMFITYIMTNLGRLLGFLIFLPFLSRMGYGLYFARIVIMFWSGIKSRVSLGMVMEYIDVINSKTGDEKLFIAHTVVLYWLTLFINGTTAPLMCRFMKLSDASLSRQVNMNNCLMYIYSKKHQALNILKMNRFIADLNWRVVKELTILKHPYEVVFMYRPNANNFYIDYDIDHYPGVDADSRTKKKAARNRDERMKVVNVKKQFYAKQFEDGIITLDVYEKLNSMDDYVWDAKEVFTELDEKYKIYLNEGFIFKILRCIVQYVSMENVRLRAPQNYWRRLCYHFINSKLYHILKYIIIIVNIILLVMLSFPSIYKKEALTLLIIIILLLFYLCDLAEIIVKVLTYSRYSIKEGIILYIRKFWNIILLITWIIFTIFLVVFDQLSLNESISHTVESLLIVAKCCRFLEILSYLEFVNIKLLKNYLNSRIDANRFFTYEVGTTFIMGEMHMLHTLPHLVQDVNLRETITTKSKKAIYLVEQHLSRIQSDKQWIATTVKTKLTIRTILNRMSKAANDLRISGWLNDGEFMGLDKSLSDQIRMLSIMRPIAPSLEKLIFREVSWMAKYPICDFLWERAVLKKFEEGEEVGKIGRVIDGIYILISGICHLEYKPDNEVLVKLKTYGCLPVIDNIHIGKFNDPINNIFVPGNIIGSLSILTNRPYDCKVRAASSCEFFFLNRAVIRGAFLQDRNTVNGLQCRMWKEVGCELALHILKPLPEWRSKTPEDARLSVNRGFVPYLPENSRFKITDKIEDLVLIQGKIIDADTKETYIAPCLIPRKVRELLLPEKIIHNKKVISVQLLIVPDLDVTEFEVMEQTKVRTAKFLTSHAAQCLHNLSLVRTKHWKYVKRSRKS